MRSLTVLIAAVLTLALGACARPPQADIDAAKVAVAAAVQDADIVAYAPKPLRTAEEKLSGMQAELNAKDYDKVKSLALEARAAAESAVEDAARNKENAQADAATLIESLKTALPAAAQKMVAARKIKGLKLAFSTFAKQLDEARPALTDAQKDLDPGSFASALRKATAIQSPLADGERMTQTPWRP